MLRPCHCDRQIPWKEGRSWRLGQYFSEGQIEFVAVKCKKYLEPLALKFKYGNDFLKS